MKEDASFGKFPCELFDVESIQYLLHLNSLLHLLGEKCAVRAFPFASVESEVGGDGVPYAPSAGVVAYCQHVPVESGLLRPLFKRQTVGERDSVHCRSEPAVCIVVDVSVNQLSFAELDLDSYLGDWVVQSVARARRNTCDVVSPRAVVVVGHHVANLVNVHLFEEIRGVSFCQTNI